jgi:hypothetical protein
MPDWVPARQDGEAVAAKLQLPMVFKIPGKRPVPPNARLELHGFIASPNPTAGLLQLQFQAEEAGSLVIQVNDLQGRVLYTREVADFNGMFNESLDLGGLPAGPVLLTVRQGDRVYTHRVVLQH